ncbi:hypothetical protein [Leptolyngbya sp. FACHB-17]|uniref:hypothetical protein n=1 Tax=unclassified Leptolyngbya TaxID=2650499 RepID=UPI00167FE9EF|nr:hypothetical protein [Leptolyngbya sp. FACHB-17]MBD2078477.1 hypothetical protein [Leptolyngbya sp. FACHB-17]
MQLKMNITAISAIGLLFLGACSSGNQATNSTSSPTAAAPAETQPSPPAGSSAKSASSGNHGGQGGQVIESGPYHLELVSKKEAAQTHIDFFLQKGDNHEPIPDAKVIAQVQLPDGSQKSLDMKYDASDKHYTAILPSATPGEYKAVILSDISGEKVNGRFSFKH